MVEMYHTTRFMVRRCQHLFHDVVSTLLLLKRLKSMKSFFNSLFQGSGFCTHGDHAQFSNQGVPAVGLFEMWVGASSIVFKP